VRLRAGAVPDYRRRVGLRNGQPGARARRAAVHQCRRTNEAAHSRDGFVSGAPVSRLPDDAVRPPARLAPCGRNKAPRAISDHPHRPAVPSHGENHEIDLAVYLTGGHLQ
jgi:hypothetical protein